MSYAKTLVSFSNNIYLWMTTESSNTAGTRSFTQVWSFVHRPLAVCYILFMLAMTDDISHVKCNILGLTEMKWPTLFIRAV